MAEGQPSQHLRMLANAIFLISFPFGLVSFALPILGKELGASALTIGGLYSAFFFMTVLLRPVVGWALDRYGRRPFLLAGFAGYVVANLAFLWDGSVTVLYAARIAQSIGSSLTWLTAYAIVADLSPMESRGRSFGQIEQSTARAQLAGVFIFFIVYAVVNRSSPAAEGSMASAWMFSFIIFVALGTYALWRIRRLPETGIGRARTAFWPSFRASWQQVSRPLLALMGIVLLTSAAFQATSPLVLIFLQDRFDASPYELALAYLPMALIWGFLPSRMGAVGDRLGRKLPMMLGLLVGGSVALSLPHAPSLLVLAGLWAIEALAFTASVPAEEALVADLSGSERHGESFGLYTFAAALGAVIGPLIGGLLYDRVGHAVPFYFTATLVFVGALLIALLVREPARQKGAA